MKRMFTTNMSPSFSRSFDSSVLESSFAYIKAAYDAGHLTNANVKQVADAYFLTSPINLAALITGYNRFINDAKLGSAILKHALPNTVDIPLRAFNYAIRIQ